MLIGLVGKPSVGKSTFFKAATLADVEIAAYPFTTIKANHGVGYVRVDCIDKEFGVQCNPAHGFCIDGQRFVPIELMDVAGLVRGASEGKGLGNQFLDDLRQADCFIHIVDVSGTTDSEGRITENHNPCEDVIFLEEELDKWFYNIFMKVWNNLVKKAEMEHTKFSEAVAKQFSGLKIDEDSVKKVLREITLPEKFTSWTSEQIMKFVGSLRKETKPMIVAANKCDSKNAKENLEKLKKEFPSYLIVPCSADCELALRQASKADLINYIPGESKFEYVKELNAKQKDALDKIQREVLEVYGSTGVQNILNKAVFELLNYIAIFPAGAKLSDSKGNILPDCFLMPSGSTALDFAYKLHKDLGDGFIRAIDARSKQAKGKEYVLKHRDGIEIVAR